MEKQAHNGSYEWESRLPKPPKPAWQVFTDCLHNPSEGTYLGRTKKQWGDYHSILTMHLKSYLWLPVKPVHRAVHISTCTPSSD